MSFTKTITYDKVELEVEYNASPNVPAQTYGPPENCSPAEGGEVEILSISVCGFDISAVISSDVEEFITNKITEELDDMFRGMEEDSQVDADESRRDY